MIAGAVHHGIALALSFYKRQWVVKDITYTTTNGQDVTSPMTSRYINAAIDPSGGRRLEEIFGGMVTDGDIGIYTHDKLYFVDQFGEGEVRKQTFIDYQGYRYRVVQVQDWELQAGVFVYLARRDIR